MAGKRKRTAPPKKGRSGQEHIIRTLYSFLEYETAKFPYVWRRTYKPDFYLGVSKATGKHVYVECKEWINDPTECSRYEAIAASLPPNTELRFLVVNTTPQTLARLERTFTVRIGQHNIDDWIGECVRTILPPN